MAKERVNVMSMFKAIQPLLVANLGKVITITYKRVKGKTCVYEIVVTRLSNNHIYFTGCFDGSDKPYAFRYKGVVKLTVEGKDLIND